MVHYLNDLALWHRQGEEYQRRIKSKPPVHPMIAVARARTREAHVEGNERALHQPASV